MVKKNKQARPVSKARPTVNNSLFLGVEQFDDRVAVIAFMAFLIIVLFVFDAINDQKALLSGSKAATTAAPITQEMADQLVSRLTINTPDQDGMAFLVKDTVDPQLLDYFASRNYDQVKAELGIQGDFAIHFEDKNGNIIPIGQKMCIGSATASINGIPCS